MDISEIMKLYNAGELDIEQANDALEEAGAPFHLEGGKASGWTKEEMELGFIENDDPKPKPLPRPDYRRNKALAGQTVRQRTKQGVYDVTYGEDGYVVKSSRYVPEDQR